MSLVSPARAPERALAHRAEAFIESSFARQYGAVLRHHYPELLAVVDAHDEVRAAVGVRRPNERFFLEQYLDSPAEVVVSDVLNTPVPRSRLVEVGSLAGGSDRRATAALMHALWRKLVDEGYALLLLTGTRTLLHRFRHLPQHQLAMANPAKVSNPRDWGSYYDSEPRVVAGALHAYDKRFRLPLPAGMRVVTLGNTGRPS